MKKWNTPEIVALDVKNTNTWFGSWGGSWWDNLWGGSNGSTTESTSAYCFVPQEKTVVDS